MSPVNFYIQTRVEISLNKLKNLNENPLNSSNITLRMQRPRDIQGLDVLTSSDIFLLSFKLSARN